MKLTLVNGNGKKYKIELPKIYILDEFINDVALDHIKENTGLNFKNTGNGYIVRPNKCQQIAKLFMTYNFMTKYFNNIDIKNVILLEFCNDEDFNKMHRNYFDV